MCTENFSLVVLCVLQSKSAKSIAQVSNGQKRKGLVKIVTGSGPDHAQASRLKAWLELEKNNDLLEADLTSWHETYSWIWHVEPSWGRFALSDWGKTELSTSLHDQLASLSRSDLPPPPPMAKCLQNFPLCWCWSSLRLHRKKRQNRSPNRAKKTKKHMKSGGEVISRSFMLTQTKPRYLMLLCLSSSYEVHFIMSRQGRSPSLITLALVIWRSPENASWRGALGLALASNSAGSFNIGNPSADLQAWRVSSAFQGKAFPIVLCYL